VAEKEREYQANWQRLRELEDELETQENPADRVTGIKEEMEGLVKVVGE